MGTFETFLNKLDRHQALLQLIGYRLQPDRLAEIEGVETSASFDPEALILRKDEVELWVDLGLPDPGMAEDKPAKLWQLRDAGVRIVISQAKDDVFSLEVERKADGTFNLNCAYDHAEGLALTPVMQQLTEEVFEIAIGASKQLDENGALEVIGCMHMVMLRLFGGVPLPTNAG